MGQTILFDGKLIDVDASLLALDRADCEDSLYFFLQKAWKWIDPSPFTDGWPLEAICEHLQAVCDGEIRKLIINQPPRTSKSTLSSVCFPAWVWAQRHTGPISGPGVQFLHASYAQQLALRDSVKCRRLIDSPWYKELWGERFSLVGDQNTKTRFDNDKKGSRLSTSVGSALTGEGGSCFVSGTMVRTPSGEAPIETLRAGDAVLAFDHSRGKVVISRVVKTARRLSRDIVEIRTPSGFSTRCTSDHRVFEARRGYVAAASLGTRDRVIICERKIVFREPSMRKLRHENSTYLVRFAENHNQQWPRLVLQRGVSWHSSCYKEQPKMRGMQKYAPAQKEKILLSILRDGNEGAAQICEGSFNRLCSLLCAIFSSWGTKAQTLFEGVCGQGAFSPHDGIWKFALHERPSYLRSVFQKYVENYKSPGWTQMRDLFRDIRAFEYRSWVKENDASCSSYRRESIAQCSGKLDSPLHDVSSEAPFWKTSVVSVTPVYCERESDVYDIQVEGQSNFFAEGILVHNCIIVDDPNAAQEAFSEATIESTIEWWDSALSTRLNDPKTGSFIIVQQRLSEEDLTGHILSKDKGEWTHLVLPMRYEPERSFSTLIGWKDPRTEPGELLWPARFGEPEVKSLESQLGGWGSAGQLQQRPEPKGGGVIKREWWQLWEPKHYPPFDYVLASLDTAYTTKTENDFSAISFWGVFSGDIVAQNVKVALTSAPNRSYSEQQAPKVMLMYAWQERLEIHDLVKKVAEDCRKMKVDKLIVENKAAGHSVSQEIRRLYDYESFSVQLYDPKSIDKLSRLYSIQHLFAEGMIYAPDKQWAETLIAQVGTFPKGKHDDLVDTCSMSLRHLRDLGMLQRAPERIAETEESMRFTGRAPPPLYSV